MNISPYKSLVVCVAQYREGDGRPPSSSCVTRTHDSLLLQQFATLFFPLATIHVTSTVKTAFFLSINPRLITSDHDFQEVGVTGSFHNMSRAISKKNCFVASAPSLAASAR
ncbi:hypothetical protein NPIL_546931 [Nephila pilipes]|uniref:Uncharacterized protein n=1 Tax=Nephila pilipes TaxID=299642 RepID=A0A8X6QPZ2_NEPPI|nr:hypothetical protein NPIL_546931 [Nephila pilipes]